MYLFDGFVLEWRDDSNGGPVVIGYRPVKGSEKGDQIRRRIWRNPVRYVDERIDGVSGIMTPVEVYVSHSETEPRGVVNAPIVGVNMSGFRRVVVA